jgi:hypothetical protein
MGRIFENNIVERTEGPADKEVTGSFRILELKTLTPIFIQSEVHIGKSREKTKQSLDE